MQDQISTTQEVIAQLIVALEIPTWSWIGDE